MRPADPRRPASHRDVRPPSMWSTVRRMILKLATAVALLASAYLAAELYVRSLRPPATQVGWRATATTVAGDGSPGFRDGVAAEARFGDPFDVAVDLAGNVYVSDAGGSDRVRRVRREGMVTTVAGAGPGFVDGPGAVARFRTPSGLSIDRDGRLYVADTGNHAIRRVAPDGEVTTLAGDGVAGYRDGPADRARFSSPMGVAVDSSGVVYVADTYNDRIRVISPDGHVSTMAGGDGPDLIDGPGWRARFDTPTDVAVSTNGELFVADAGNNALRRLGRDGSVSTFGFPAIGHARYPMLYRPVSLAITHDDFLYVTDRRGYIVQVTPDGGMRTLAGAGLGFANGAGSIARFNNPTGIAFDLDGGLRIADAANYLIRRLAPLEDGGEAGASQVDEPAETEIGEPLPRITREALGGDALLWPIDPQDTWQEVTGTLGEARAGSGGDGRARFHAGLDVRGDYGAIVRAVRDEVVTEVLSVADVGRLAESASVGLLRYVHLRVGRDHRGRPLADSRFTLLRDERNQPTRVRIPRGTPIAAGDPLGTINRAYHTHLELGPPGVEINPLSVSMIGFTDHVPPTIRRNGVRLFDRDGRRLSRRVERRLVVRGPVRVVVDAYDQVDGNLARRRLGLYRLGYQVLHPDGLPAPGFEEPRITIEFDRLPSERGAPHLAFAAGSGITVYGNPITRFRYIVTNIVRGGTARPGTWDTSELAPGDYILRIIAADHAGNVATARRDIDVTVEAE